MLNDHIFLDYNNMLTDQIGPEQGLSPESLTQLEPALAQAHQLIQEKSGRGADFLGFLHLPYHSDDFLQGIITEADRLAALGDAHVVLGIGGSYLGAKALTQALCHPYHNELPRERRNHRPRIYFEGNNLDADALGGLLDILPKSAPQNVNENWTMNVISKSGGTIETAVGFRILRQLAEKHYGSHAARHITATTDVARGQLKSLSTQKGYQTFVIPDDVGGRYSILTPVGLLPACVAGIDIRQLVQGARDMAETCAHSQGLENPAYLYAALQYLSYQAGRQVSVMSIWDKGLESVGFWYDQLCAESLGKDQTGRTPLTAVCTRDLHSRGQELQDGLRNTVITNLFVSNSHTQIPLVADADNTDQLNYLVGKSVHDMLHSAFHGTNFAYSRDQRPNMSFILKERSAYTLGALFYLLELATVAEGYLMQINPLDQPGVEAYKKFMFGLLGRADMQVYKQEFENRKPESPRYRM